MTDSRTFELSIVVCTFNRAELLRGALRSLEQQSEPAESFEVLIVDNNSTDSTRAIAEEFCLRLPHFRLLQEPRQGLSCARNRGWREASGRYVGYLDDDARAGPDWVRTALEIIGNRNPEAFGGPYLAFYDTPKPAWFKDEYGSYYPARSAGPLDPDRFLSGSNMFYRRNLLETLGGFEAALGMKGSNLGYGEETSLQIRLRESQPGALILAEPSLIVFHRVAPEKMLLPRIIRHRFTAGRDAYRVFVKRASGLREIAGAAIGTLGACLGLVAGLVQGGGFRDRSLYPYAMNYFYERTAAHIGRLGTCYEQFLAALRGGRTS